MIAQIIERSLRSIDPVTHPNLKDVSKIWEVKITDKHFLRTEYIVYYTEIKGYIHLRVSRWDKLPSHNWEHIQCIKNKILGKEAQAVEIYPRESELMNGCNMYHLWVIPNMVLPNLRELYEYK